MPVEQVPADQDLQPERLERLLRNLQLHGVEGRAGRRDERHGIARREPPGFDDRGTAARPQPATSRPPLPRRLLPRSRGNAAGSWSGSDRTMVGRRCVGPPELICCLHGSTSLAWHRSGRAVGLPALPAAQEPNSKVKTPAKGDSVVVKGCLMGPTLQSTETVSTDDTGTLSTPLTYQLKGDKKLLKQLRDENDGKLVEVTGILKSVLPQDSAIHGKTMGKTKVTLGIGAPSAQRGAPAAEWRCRSSTCGRSGATAGAADRCDPGLPRRRTGASHVHVHNLP